MDYRYDAKTELINFSFTGHLDASTSKEADQLVQRGLNEILTKRTEPLESSKIKCVFDMKEVDFVSSSFLRICIATAKRFPSGNFSVQNTSPAIKRTFVLAGIDNIVKIS